MILAFDTYYYDDQAKTVCITFKNWADTLPDNTYIDITDNVAEYEPGAFYKRELPCILNTLKKIDLSQVDIIIIDGFVFLDDDNKPGLGNYLYKALEKKIPVIGVAKTNFAQIHKNKRALLRGKSVKPLFITSIGIDLDLATEKIKTMHGEYRIPDLLKDLDRLTKE
jgi:deoxyribonuclease V